MKVIVCSDSHGNLTNMLEMVKKEQPDLLLHLGDTAHDADRLVGRLPRLRVVRVPGNCDGWGEHGPAELLIEEGGVRLFMMHGHTAQVKLGYALAIRKAREAGADVLLFGHTHFQTEEVHGDLLLMNPGSIRAGEYGALELDGGKILCRLERLF